ncbi:MAG: hypothetical protein RL224_581 [Actinomycetota bacterium]|jgi:hypothetical protein
MPLEIWIAILGGLGVIIFSSLSAGKKGKNDDETER